MEGGGLETGLMGNGSRYRAALERIILKVGQIGLGFAGLHLLWETAWSMPHSALHCVPSSQSLISRGCWLTFHRWNCGL